MLREDGLVDTLRFLGWRIASPGDCRVTMVPPRSEPHAPAMPDPSVKIPNNAWAVGTGNYHLFQKTHDHASRGNFVLTLGGDHSVALGSIAGILKARPNIGLIWIDAHADLNTPNTSISGNLHGMPLAFLMGLVDPRAIPGHEWLHSEEVPRLQPEQLVYVGLRDLDEAERRMIPDLGIRAYTMQDIDRKGIGKIMEMALDHVHRDANGRPRPLHASYDIDAVDPAHAPCTGTIVRGGLTWREARFAAEEIFASGQLASMDLVEVNPHLRRESNETVELGHSIIGDAMGRKIL